MYMSLLFTLPSNDIALHSALIQTRQVITYSNNDILMYISMTLPVSHYLRLKSNTECNEISLFGKAVGNGSISSEMTKVNEFDSSMIGAIAKTNASFVIGAFGKMKLQSRFLKSPETLSRSYRAQTSLGDMLLHTKKRRKNIVILRRLGENPYSLNSRL